MDHAKIRKGRLVAQKRWHHHGDVGIAGIYMSPVDIGKHDMYRV